MAVIAVCTQSSVGPAAHVANLSSYMHKCRRRALSYLFFAPRSADPNRRLHAGSIHAVLESALTWDEQPRQRSRCILFDGHRPCTASNLSQCPWTGPQKVVGTQPLGIRSQTKIPLLAIYLAPTWRTGHCRCLMIYKVMRGRGV